MGKKLDLNDPIDFPDHPAHRVWFSQKYENVIAEQTFPWSNVVHLYAVKGDGSLDPSEVFNLPTWVMDGNYRRVNENNMIELSRIREN